MENLQELRKKFVSVRQAAEKAEVAITTVYKYINARLIEVVRIDSHVLIPVTELPKIKEQYIEPKRAKAKDLKGYKSVGQAAKQIGMKFRTLKGYLLNDELEYTVEDGIYYIPDNVVEELASLGDNPNLKKLKARRMGCFTVQEAAEYLGYSDQYIRQQIRAKVLTEKRDEDGRRFVTIESADAFGVNPRKVSQVDDDDEEDEEIDDLVDML